MVARTAHATMKAIPTLNRGLRLEIHEPDDWKLLGRLLLDARDPGFDLAEDLAGRMHNETIAEDWSDFVVPDLRETFESAVTRVARAIEDAHRAHKGGPGQMTIPREAGGDWYGTLNQARLALEARHSFGADGIANSAAALTGYPPEKRAAFLRDRFYGALQCVILDHVFD